MRRVALFTLTLLFLAGSTEAARKWFHCVGPNECQITQENRVGPLFKSGDARAAKKASVRVASVCVAAGFSYFQVLDESGREGKHAGPFGGWQAASKTIRARFFHEEVENSYPCSFGATPKYIEVARKIAAKNGYPWPVEKPE